MAQNSWYKTVNIGQHFNLNYVEEETVPEEQILNFFTGEKDHIFHPDFMAELEEAAGKWEIIGEGNIPPDFRNDPFYVPEKEVKIEYSVAKFSGSKVNLLVFFRFGSSRWHSYNGLLKNLILPRTAFIDSLLNMEHYDNLYKKRFRGIGHGISASEMETELGRDYFEYLGQSLQLRNIYYGKHNLEIYIQDVTVMYIKEGRPNWMDSDSVVKHKQDE